VVISFSYVDMLALGDGAATLTGLLAASGVGWPGIAATAWIGGYTAWAVAHHQCFWFWIPYWQPWSSNSGFYAC
jgi:hypothetical protein